MSVIRKEFHLKAPTDGLIIWGFILILVIVTSVSLQSPASIFGAGILAKIFILVWLPKIVKRVGRNSVIWTIAAFLVPSITLIALSFVGYKRDEKITSLINECSEAFQKKQDELIKALEEGEISYDEYDEQVKKHDLDLQDYCQEQLISKYNNYDTNFANKLLKKQGYVTDENSEVFVDYVDNCPACNSKLDKKNTSCPECGLVLG